MLQGSAYAKLTEGQQSGYPKQEQVVNWLDLVITVTWISGLFLGWKMGLFGAVFAAGGAVVGVFLAARFSDNVADLLTDSVTSDTLATVIAYVAILALVFTAAQVLRTVLIEGLKRVAMGWLDPVGGMLLGLVAGLALAGALVTVMARYSSDLPEDSNGTASSYVSLARSDLQQNVRGPLVESSLVPLYLDFVDSTLGSAILSPVPEDFSEALHILEMEIDVAETNAQ